MSDHLTHESPSWYLWLSSIIGWTVLPTPINCWYCNQTSYLLPGSRQTERHWYCNLCENTNVIDEFGDIVDAPPLPQTTLNYGQGSSSRLQHKPLSTSSTSDRRTLCDSCQSSQIRIYQYLSDYLSDENDPNYSELLENADSYQQSLHEKNPLCDECQKKVQDVKCEQRDTMRRRRLNEQRDRSLHTKTPIRLTKKQYYRHGFLFVFLHSTVFVLCILVYFCPPRSLKHEIVTIPLRKWLVFAADFISTFFKFTDEQPTTVLLSTMSTLPEGTKFSELSDHSYCMKNIFKLIATEILNLIGFLWNGLTMFIDQLLANNSNPGQTQYSWDATDMGILCWLSFYASSFLFMGWHSRASRSFSVAKGLKSYHALQWILYWCRFAFLYSIGFMSFTKHSFVVIVFSVMYALVLVYSCLSVAVKNSVLPGGENEVDKESMAPRIPPKPYSPTQSPSTATTQTNVDHSIPLELDGSGDRQSRHQIEVEELASELKRIRV